MASARKPHDSHDDKITEIDRRGLIKKITQIGTNKEVKVVDVGQNFNEAIVCLTRGLSDMSIPNLVCAMCMHAWGE